MLPATVYMGYYYKDNKMISNETFKNIKLPEKKFTIIPDLVRWAKKNKLMDKDTQRPNIDLTDGEYAVPLKEKSKIKKISIKTGRLKNHKTNKYEVTKIKPEDRSMKNLPKYANKKSKVRFQDWLMLKKSPKLYDKYNNYSWGWSPNGKCYGWSHRAMFGFKVGDKIKIDTIGNWKKEVWTIKTEVDAERMAKEFARDVS